MASNSAQSLAFDSLNDDMLRLTLQFVGKRSYVPFGGINRRCHGIYLTSKMPKETFVYGYAPLPFLIERYNRFRNWRTLAVAGLGKCVFHCNRNDVLDWALQEQNTLVLKSIYKEATISGSLDVLKKISNNNDFFQEEFYELAGSCGHLHVLKWFETNNWINIMIRNNCARKAAQEGHLHVLEWLEDRGCIFNDETLVSAARGSHVNVVKWLRSKGCPWNDWIFETAAQFGKNLDILILLRNEGCPWRDNTIIFEHKVKHEVLFWVLNHGYCFPLLP